MIEDRLLIWRCKCGNQAAFQRIYEKYESDLRTLAANLIEDKAAAEDIVHDVFISLLLIIEEFQLKKSLAGYLKTCVANKARNYTKKKQHQTLINNETEQLTSEKNEPVQLVIQNEEQKKLGFAMNQLPYEQREAIVFYLHGEMKFKAIAKMQEVSIKTAHSRYKAGLDKLKSMLNGEITK